MIAYAPFLGQLKARPSLAQYPVPSFGPNRSQRAEDLRRQLESTLNVYRSVPFDQETSSRLFVEVQRCQTLLANVIVGPEDLAAEATVKACIEDLQKNLSTAAETAFAASRAESEEEFKTNLVVLGSIAAISAGVSAYHGYKRNNSTGWAAWWGLMGLLFPVVTPVVAIAQGYGKRVR